MKQSSGIDIVSMLIAKNLGGKPSPNGGNCIDITSWLLGKKSGGGGDVETPFTENQAPIVWSVDGNSATGENDYGTWKIECDIAPNSGDISLAFDGDSSTLTGWAARMNPLITLSLPEGVSICPKKVYLMANGSNLGTQVFDALNEETNEWETLATGIPGGTVPIIPYYPEFSTTNFYTKFRLKNVAKSSRIGSSVTDLAIEIGTIKIKK